MRVCLSLVLFAVPAVCSSSPCRFFAIQVCDSQTGRGVPLVELRTVHNIRYVTDSNGFAAVYEPGLMGKRVFFFVRSHGYSFRAGGFGFRGFSVKLKPGGFKRVAITRVNVAERLYRITGAGIYRDTVLLGRKAPIKEALLNAGVLGQDSVFAVPYRGKIFWFWGDTLRASHPLGNFHTTGATSALPGEGLNPDRGIELKYFEDGKGFVKPMCPLPGRGVVWLEGFITVSDEHGRTRLVAQYSRMKDLGTCLERGLCLYNDKRNVFEPVVRFDLKWECYLRGHPIRVRTGGREYFYFGQPHPSPFPNVRVPATLAAIKDPSSYEVYSCFAGKSYEPAELKAERDQKGLPRYVWRRLGVPFGTERQRELQKGGVLGKGEGWLGVRDVLTGRRLNVHAGTVRWNDYRKRWILIACEKGGESSFLGEIWYAEADSPVGPWVYARKVVTHDRYSFYNPVHHGFLDKDGGRVIYFEGTYSHTFSRTQTPTARYDYNQIMYRLDLADPRVRLPVPVYRVRTRGGRIRFACRREVVEKGWEDRIEGIPFFAFEPHRPDPDLIPIVQTEAGGGIVLKKGPGSAAGFSVLDPASGRRLRSPDLQLLLPSGALTRAGPHGGALGFVWRNPLAVSVFDLASRPGGD